MLEDLTCHLPPDGWARRVVHGLQKWKADRIIAEANNGGQLRRNGSTDDRPLAPANAGARSRGKLTRAEPIAALYEQGKVHHVGGFPELEDQLCTWVPGASDSPDRLDALVWALTELAPGAVSISMPSWSTKPSRYGALMQRAGGGSW